MDKESSNSPVDWQCIHVTVWTAAGEDLGKKSTKINRKFLRSQKAAIFGRKKMTWNHLAQFIDWRHDVIQVSLVVARCRLVGLRRTNKGRQSSRHKNCFASKATEESLHALLAESQMPQNYYHLRMYSSKFNIIKLIINLIMILGFIVSLQRFRLFFEKDFTALHMFM